MADDWAGLAILRHCPRCLTWLSAEYSFKGSSLLCIDCAPRDGTSPMPIRPYGIFGKARAIVLTEKGRRAIA
jgi:hypothetical protein